MGEKGHRAGGKSGRYCSASGMTLGLRNLVCILTLWGCVLEKHIGFSPHHVLLFSHREWGRPAETAGCTTSPSDMTVSNWLHCRRMEPFQ